jgi:hypothetical protein
MAMARGALIRHGKSIPPALYVLFPCRLRTHPCNLRGPGDNGLSLTTPLDDSFVIALVRLVRIHFIPGPMGILAEDSLMSISPYFLFFSVLSTGYRRKRFEFRVGGVLPRRKPDRPITFWQGISFDSPDLDAANKGRDFIRVNSRQNLDGMLLQSYKDSNE